MNLVVRLIVLMYMFTGMVGCSTIPAAATGIGPPVRDEQRRFETITRHSKAIKEENVVMQRHEYTCGAAALATMFQYYFGENISEQEILHVVRNNLTREQGEDEWRLRFQAGLSMKDLSDAAKSFGFRAAVVPDKRVKTRLNRLQVPIIIRLQTDQFSHFVVLRGAPVQDFVFLADPIRGQVRMPVWELDTQWDGTALFLSKPGFQAPPTNPLQLSRTPSVYTEFQTVRRFLALPSNQ